MRVPRRKQYEYEYDACEVCPRMTSTNPSMLAGAKLQSRPSQGPARHAIRISLAIGCCCSGMVICICA